MSQHVEFFHFFIFNKFRVPTQPGKMRVHLENLEIWNFEKFNKYHGKMTWNLGKLATKNSPLTPLKLYKIY